MKTHRRILVIALLVVIGGAVGLQFWPTGFDRTNPPVVQEPPWDAPETRALAVRACFDCHSNETIWPWYSRVAPLSWMIEQDVQKGRAVLNFSIWNAAQSAAVETEEVVELVSTGAMPLPYYEILHPAARLTSGEQGVLINGLIRTLQTPDDATLTTDDLDEEESSD